MRRALVELYLGRGGPGRWCVLVGPCEGGGFVVAENLTKKEAARWLSRQAQHFGSFTNGTTRSAIRAFADVMREGVAPA